MAQAPHKPSIAVPYVVTAFRVHPSKWGAGPTPTFRGILALVLPRVRNRVAEKVNDPFRRNFGSSYSAETMTSQETGKAVVICLYRRALYNGLLD